MDDKLLFADLCSCNDGIKFSLVAVASCIKVGRVIRASNFNYGYFRLHNITFTTSNLKKNWTKASKANLTLV